MISGAVLCGGASRRMGTDKALVPIDGVPMAERVARALAAGGCTPVTLIGGDAAALAMLDRPRKPDRWPGEGPLGGVITALGAERDAVVVAACDLACLDGATVEAFVTASRDLGPAVDVVVAHTDRLEPALAWWSPRCLPELERSFAAGVRALHEAITSLRWRTVSVDPATMRNVNAPSDVPRIG